MNLNDRLRSSLLWGAVGVFAFLAAAQGYQLLFGALRVSMAVWAGVAVLVGVAATATTYAFDARLGPKGRT